ncbi:unnamed protein product [Closterium sp. Naga37s-1]|nr:unnamed protein product [Closterium sp. Naga37s-1]
MAYSWNTIQDKILFVTEVMGRSIADIVIAMLAEREGAEDGEKGGGEEDGGEEGGREEDGWEKGREKGGLGEGEGDIEGGTTGADVEEERGR